MKNKNFWILLLFVLIFIFVIGYVLNWWGIKKSPQIAGSRIISNIMTNQISCPTGCTLSLNTTGASQTASQGNNTYTCRCSDGSTTAPIVS